MSSAITGVFHTPTGSSISAFQILDNHANAKAMFLDDGPVIDSLLVTSTITTIINTVSDPIIDNTMSTVTIINTASTPIIDNTMSTVTIINTASTPIIDNTMSAPLILATTSNIGNVTSTEQVTLI